MEKVLIFVAAYFGLLFALSVWAKDARRTVSKLADDLRGSYPADADVASFCNDMKSGALSWRSAPIELFAMLSLAFVPMADIDRKAQRQVAERPYLRADGRFERIDEAYLISSIATNPIFGAMLMMVLAVQAVRATLYYRDRYQPLPTLSLAMLNT